VHRPERPRDDHRGHGLGARHYLVKPWKEEAIASKLQLIAPTGTRD